MSDRKLYAVTIEYEVFVLAGGEHDAEYEAERAVRQGDADGFAMAREVASPRTLARDDLASIPFGSDDDRTVGEILAGVPEEWPDGAPLVPAPVVPDKDQTSLDFPGQPPNTGSAT